MGDERVIHLSKQVGLPAIWSLDEFTKNDRYKVFIGAKRVIFPMPHGAALSQSRPVLG
jgi:hypothetical protein